MEWTKLIPEKEITNGITKETDDFAKEFGKHLGTEEKVDKKILREKLNTNQLRKFFGEVKRQQMRGYNPTDFILLKPKLAYAVGRAPGNNPKIKDFYKVLSHAIDQVTNEDQFKRFIKIFEAIVAYHKAAENNIDIN